jgi:hypothetical protein
MLFDALHAAVDHYIASGDMIDRRDLIKIVRTFYCNAL